MLEELSDLGIQQIQGLSEKSPDYDPSPLIMPGTVVLEDQYEVEITPQRSRK